MSIILNNTDKIIALGVVIPTILVMGYQAIMQQELTMPTEPAMIILGFYFGKKINDRVD